MIMRFGGVRPGVLSRLGIALVAGLVLTSCPDTVKDSGVEGVESVKIVASTTEVLAGSTITLVAEVEGGSDLGVSWESLTGTCATVDADGVVTGEKEGTETIVATSRENGVHVAWVVVTVREVVATTPVSRVRILSSTRKLTTGSTENLVAEVEGGSEMGVRWSSSDTDVATVDEDTGKLTGRAPGSVEIRATSVEDSTKFAATLFDVDYSPVAGVIIKHGIISVTVGAKVYLSAVVLDGDSPSKGVTWSSSDEEKAIIRYPGRCEVVTKAAGNVEITASSVQDPSKVDTVTITINPPVSKVEITGFDEKGYNKFRDHGTSVHEALRHGHSTSGTYPVVTPLLKRTTLLVARIEGGSGMGVVWSSEDETIATVTSYGVVEPGRYTGTTYIRATSIEDPEISDTMKVYRGEYIPPADPVIIDSANEVEVGNTIILNILDPGYAINQGVTWSITEQDKLFASISRSNNPYEARLTGIAPGIVTITATYTTPISVIDYSTTKTIVVKETPVVAVVIDTEVKEVAVDETITLTATVLGGGYTKGVSWSSLHEQFATVNSTTGEVKGVAEGTATIRATSTHDTGKYAEVEITITATEIAQ